MNRLITALLLLLGVALLPAAAADVIYEDGYIKEGVALHEKGQYSEAIKLYDLVLKQNPHNEIALYEKAYSLVYLGKNRVAMRIARKLTKSEDDKIVELAYTMYGNIIDDMGLYNKSEKVYKEALLRFPQNYLLNYNLAVSYAARGKFELCRRYLLESLNYYPIHLNSIYSLTIIDSELENGLGAVLASLFFLFYSDESDKRGAEVRSALLKLYEEIGQRELKMEEKADMTLDLATNFMITTALAEIRQQNPEERENLLPLVTAQLLRLYSDHVKGEISVDELSPWQVDCMQIIKHIDEEELTESFLAKIAGEKVEKERLSALYDIVKAFYR